MEQWIYRRLLTQFAREYWPAFHDVVDAQRTTPGSLGAPVFDALVEAHLHFAAAYGAQEPAIETLGGIWSHVAARRRLNARAGLSAREIVAAGSQFQRIAESLRARGLQFPGVARQILAHASDARTVARRVSDMATAI